MDNWAILLQVAIFLPSAGALAIALAWPRKPEAQQAASRFLALAAVLLTFALSGVLIAKFPAGSVEFAVSTGAFWFGDARGGAEIQFSLGLDGLSLWLFGLTSLLMITAIAVSWKAIDRYCRAYYSLLLVLETGMLGVFCARDIILFYVFFEATLIPLFFLIGVWGSSDRRYAAIKFFLFTLAGSLLTFLGLLAIVWWNYSQSRVMTFSIWELTSGLMRRPMPVPLQLTVFLALFAGFSVKVPLFPLHTWLPLAHVEAPTAGSVVLAGILLKIGGYGFVRFSLPMLPEATALLMPWLVGLSAAGIIYGALVALAQADIKRLIAYSSVSHLGFCMLGIFAANRLGIQGGVLQMVNHGLSTGGLFALVGMLYERYHTREIRAYGGIARRLPVLAFFMLLMTLSSIGLPGLNGFAGEFLLLVGMFQRAWAGPIGPLALYRAVSVLAVFGVVLGAWYMLWLVERVFFGPLREPAVEHGQPSPPIRDLSAREVAGLIPLVVFIVWIGLQPSFFLNRMGPALDRLTAAAVRAADRDGPAGGDRFAETSIAKGDLGGVE
ncbi:MAG: complex I subunit 4 family protein [Thermoguttaceae bacterium]|jgi:NADH-quinone oxidoreductase subunit M